MVLVMIVVVIMVLVGDDVGSDGGNDNSGGELTLRQNALVQPHQLLKL